MAKGLTPQQRYFAAEVATGKCTLAEAAIRAGYSPKTANSQGSQLLSNPKIAAEVNRIQAKAAVQAIGSKEEALNAIWEIARDAQANSARRDALAAYELWMKARGELVEKREVEQTSTVIEIEWPTPGGPTT